jgi:four helix bundle protein
LHLPIYGCTCRNSRFEKLKVWVKAKDLALDIYRLSSIGPFSRDWSMKDQIRKAAVSVPSNIAEGQGRFGKKEFMNFLSIANGSVYEIITQVHIARDLGFITPIEAAELIGRCSEISKMIKGLRKKQSLVSRKRAGS